MRTITLIGVCGFALGIGGAGAGFAAQAWSGDLVLEQSLAAEPRRPKKNKNEERPSRRKTWELAVELEPAMSALAGTLSLPQGQRFALRIFDPQGREVFTGKGSTSRKINKQQITFGEDHAHFFMGPIEVAMAGPHRIECDVPRYADTSFNLRRNVVFPTLTWFFSMLGLAMISGASVIFSVIIGSVGRSQRQRSTGRDQ